MKCICDREDAMKKRLVMLIVLVLAVLLPFALAEAATKPIIPGGALTYKGHSYYIYKSNKNWEGAEKACEKVGGHLVTISNAAENAFVTKYTQKIQPRYGWIWIGFCNKYETDGWQWVTGEPVNYVNWLDPDFDYSYFEYAGLFINTSVVGAWDFCLGDWEQYYMCEWDTVSVTVSAPKTVKADQPASGTVRLTWTKGKNAKKYAIWRKDESASDYVKIGETTKLTYKDKKVKNGQIYKYKIQAVNGDKSAYSSVVKACPLPKLTGLKAKVSGKTNIVLSWKKVKGAKHYYIYQKGPKDDEFKKLHIDTSSTKVMISVKNYFGKYKFYVVPAYGSFEGLKSSKVSIKIENPVTY